MQKRIELQCLKILKPIVKNWLNNLDQRLCKIHHIFKFLSFEDLIRLSMPRGCKIPFSLHERNNDRCNYVSHVFDLCCFT